jgi:type I restriction enzyme S subunit
MEGTSGRKRVNEGALKLQVLPIPDKTTQQKIASVLSSLDSKIELNNRINAELEAMAKTLYDYWFVQFDFPNVQSKPYKSSGGKMVWNEELKREIPEGWKVKSLAEITAVSNESINPMDSPDKEFKYYSIPGFDTSGTFAIEKGEEIKSNKFKVEATDVLVSKLNPWFSRVIYSTDDSNLVCSTEFVVWRTSDIAIKNYMYMIARDASFVTYCTQSASGTSNSHKRVNPTVMMKYQIVYNDKIARLFGTTLGSTIKMYAKNQIENQQLSALRDWLLPMLMNGQVTVGE